MKSQKSVHFHEVVEVGSVPGASLPCTAEMRAAQSHLGMKVERFQPRLVRFGARVAGDSSPGRPSQSVRCFLLSKASTLLKPADISLRISALWSLTDLFGLLSVDLLGNCIDLMVCGRVGLCCFTKPLLKLVVLLSKFSNAGLEVLKSGFEFMGIVSHGLVLVPRVRGSPLVERGSRRP